MIEALETKHYATAAGEYLGGFGGVRRTTETPNPREVVAVDPDTGEESRYIEYDPPTITVSEEWPEIPKGAVEVPGPPPSPLHRWGGAVWAPPAPAAETAARLDEVRKRIAANPELVALADAIAARLRVSGATLIDEAAALLAEPRPV